MNTHFYAVYNTGDPLFTVLTKWTFWLFICSYSHLFCTLSDIRHRLYDNVDQGLIGHCKRLLDHHYTFTFPRAPLPCLYFLTTAQCLQYREQLFAPAAHYRDPVQKVEVLWSWIQLEGEESQVQGKYRENRFVCLFVCFFQINWKIVCNTISKAVESALTFTVRLAFFFFFF